MARQSTAPGCWCFSCIGIGFFGSIAAGCHSMTAGISVFVLSILVGVVPLLVYRSLAKEGDIPVTEEAFSPEEVKAFKKLPRHLRPFGICIVAFLFLGCLLTKSKDK